MFTILTDLCPHFYTYNVEIWFNRRSMSRNPSTTQNFVRIARVLSTTSYQCNQKPRGSHMDIPVTYLLTYLLECWCVYLVHPKFDLYILSNKSRQNSFLAVSVKWISVNVNMFAIYHLSQIRHSQWYCLLIHCSLLSIIGVIVQTWFTPPDHWPLLHIC